MHRDSEVSKRDGRSGTGREEGGPEITGDKDYKAQVRGIYRCRVLVSFFPFQIPALPEQLLDVPAAGITQLVPEA